MDETNITDFVRECEARANINNSVGRIAKRVLVACEFSGIVRDAFTARGHAATSCDLLPTERPGAHFQCDVRDLDLSPYDIMIAFPPCTHLATSGRRWFGRKVQAQSEALDFVRWLLNVPIQCVALENPVSIISSKVCRPNQIIQPWQFGHGEKKAICLWLKNLPRLVSTNVVPNRVQRVQWCPPSEGRWKKRSRTLQGVADAMADQWGKPFTMPKRRESALAMYV